MFIIPIQDRVDWRRPPVLALILVILNSVIYFWSVGYDAERYAELERVDDAKLSQYEWPLYIDWLRDTDPAMWLEVRPDGDAPRVGALQSAWFNRAVVPDGYAPAAVAAPALVAVAPPAVVAVAAAVAVGEPLVSVAMAALRGLASVPSGMRGAPFGSTPPPTPHWPRAMSARPAASA